VHRRRARPGPHSSAAAAHSRPQAGAASFGCSCKVPRGEVTIKKRGVERVLSNSSRKRFAVLEPNHAMVLVRERHLQSRSRLVFPRRSLKDECPLHARNHDARIVPRHRDAPARIARWALFERCPRTTSQRLDRKQIHEHSRLAHQ